MLDARQLEAPLTAQETLLRDAFVSEYLKDFNAHQACIRLGFQPTFATGWAKRLWEDGYVQRKIAHMTRVPVASPEQDAADRALVEVTLRRVMQTGSDSARVAAARQFSAMRGWAADDGAGDEDLVEQFRRLAQALPA